MSLMQQWSHHFLFAFRSKYIRYNAFLNGVYRIKEIISKQLYENYYLPSGLVESICRLNKIILHRSSSCSCFLSKDILVPVWCDNVAACRCFPFRCVVIIKLINWIWGGRYSCLSKACTVLSKQILYCTLQLSLLCWMQFKWAGCAL